MQDILSMMGLQGKIGDTISLDLNDVSLWQIRRMSLHRLVLTQPQNKKTSGNSEGFLFNCVICSI